MAKVRIVGPKATPECLQAAAAARAYCESKSPVGESTAKHTSVTGQPYSQFCLGGYATAEAARAGMQKCFDEYAQGKSGALYWRVPPEIVYGKAYAFYMRLLISDKPRLGDA